MTASLRHTVRFSVATDHPRDLPPLEEVEDLLLPEIGSDPEFEAWLHATRPMPKPDPDLDGWIADARRDFGRVA